VCNCLIQFLLTMVPLRNVFFLLNTSFDKVIDTPIQC
jgi:hypothetical protein